MARMKPRMDEKELIYILKECKESYKQNDTNLDKIDNKLAQFFALNTGLLMLFFRFIEHPDNIFMVVIYWITVFLFILILGLLIYAYNPMEYLTITPNNLVKAYYSNRYKSKEGLIWNIAKATADNVPSITRNLKKKSIIIRVSASILLLALIFMLILNALGGVMNV